MGVSVAARRMRKEVLNSWGDELPGLHLNLFADELPAAYFRFPIGKGPEDFPVLRRAVVRAKVRRGCFAEALSVVRDMIATSTLYIEDDSGWLSGVLPAAFRARYDLDFHRQMLALTTSLWERMEDGTFIEPWCTAEEILLGIVLIEYELRLGSAELETGIVDLDSYWLEDDDYQLLYNSEIAERDDVLTALADELYTVNLDFASWFKPFRNSFPIPAPTSESELRRINGGRPLPNR
jgi:hypothetical protein